MFEVYENSLKTGFIGKGKGMRHRYDFQPVKQKKEPEPEVEEEAVVTESADYEEPLTATLGKSQLDTLKKLGS